MSFLLCVDHSDTADVVIVVNYLREATVRAFVSVVLFVYVLARLLY